MSFFKPSTDPVTDKSVARLQGLIWILIYGGLLAVVLGFFVQRTDDEAGWSLLVAGAVVAAVGFALIYVRSKMNVQK